jgi:preprotein translocase subunit YajC
MSFFISDAMAEGAANGAQTGSPVGSLFFMLVIFAVFYFMLIRPQAKRAKEHKKMTEALQKGDEVITNGGVLGKITGIADDYLTVQIADNVEVKVQRGAVATLLPKGTVKETGKG